MQEQQKKFTNIT